jgi:acyl-CoA synthetase (AMP-forming)/AMP-acid ligase II
MTPLHIELTEYQKSLRGLSMPAALDLAATTHGDEIAIIHVEGGGPTLTWAAFRERVSKLRSGLQRAGVKAGDRVGVQLRNQVEFPLTWFAVAELGAAIVPLNPKYTTRESEFVLSDAGAAWLVAAHDILENYGPVDSYGPVPRDRVITVAGKPVGTLTFETLAQSDITPFAAYPDQDEIANIQFTSGTTGLPKGCLLTHRYWVELGVWDSGLFNARRILADHPFYYMQNQAYLMTALASGGAICVTSGMSRRKFMGWLVDHQIDMAWIDEEMVDLPPSDNDAPLLLKRAPVAAVPPEGIALLEEHFGIVARDFYASTEVGNGTFVPWDRRDLAMKGSMGFCFPTRESKIIDSNLQEVPVGVSGELCLRGEGMMLGYHNRDEVNAELFLPGGWFRTGDIVRKDAEGAHYYEGRLKDMVSRSGENIASAEVELQILLMPEVHAVGVIPVPDRERGEEVKAIVVLKDGARVSAEDVVVHARTGLAAFKVPRYVEFRTELPYTASGKVHKAALKAEEPLNKATVDVTRLDTRSEESAEATADGR